jgi:hypothetical protein
MHTGRPITRRPVIIVSIPTRNRSHKVSQRVQGSYIEPSQAASRYAQNALLSSTSTFLQTENAPEPVYRFYLAEIILLFVEVRSDIIAEKCKERGNGEGFVAVTEDFIVDRVFVEEI